VGEARIVRRMDRGKSGVKIQGAGHSGSASGFFF